MKLLNLFHKSGLFGNFQIWLFVSQKPLEVYTHTIPHLKAVMSCSLDSKGLRCGSTFTLYHALLKNVIFHAFLYYRMGLGCRDFPSGVYLNGLKNNIGGKFEKSHLYKDWVKKMTHVPKLAISKRSTIFVRSSWNLVKIITSWGNHFDQVSWG